MKERNTIPVKKNGEYIVEIIDKGFEGEGIAKIENYTIFIENAIKGEICKILIVKVNTSHAFGKIIEVVQQAVSRKVVDCTTYQRCGGCSLRHINYETTLQMKQNVVQNLISKTLSTKVIVDKTIGMENPMHYRNKAQYPFGIDKQNEMIVGIYAKRTHDIIPMQNCLIQNSISEIIAKSILETIKKYNITVYNEQNQKRDNEAYCRKNRFKNKTSNVYFSSKRN